MAAIAARLRNAEPPRRTRPHRLTRPPRASTFIYQETSHGTCHGGSARALLLLPLGGCGYHVPPHGALRSRPGPGEASGESNTAMARGPSMPPSAARAEEAATEQ
eukprot:1045081-Prymnesium_polylepis.1